MKYGDRWEEPWIFHYMYFFSMHNGPTYYYELHTVPVSGNRFSNMQSNETRNCLTCVSICVPTVQTIHTVTFMQLLLK
jgi:hypothetical protein